MLNKKGVKARMIRALVVCGALALAFMPTLAWAVDSDLDGLDDSIERTGFTLSANLTHWGGGTSVPGSDGCADPGACLSASKVDMFVIVRLASTSNLDPSRIQDYFECLRKDPSAGGLGWNVWVLREVAPVNPADRRITPDSPQMAVLLIEDLDTGGTKQGIAQYGSIMTFGKGVARIYSQRVVEQIDGACSANPTECKDVSGVLYTASSLKFLHLSWVIVHECLHVLFELDNALRRVEGHHVTRGDTVMKAAVVYTEKKGKVTYHIPQEISRTAQTEWAFY